MRSVSHGDICAAARVLLALPEADWPRQIATLLDEAHHADRYRKAFARYHPRLGTGTLMSAALARRPAPAPPVSETRHLQALAFVLEAVLARRAAGQGGC